MRESIGVYNGMSKEMTLDVVFLDSFVTEEKLRERRSRDDEAVLAWTESTQKTHDEDTAREQTSQVSFGPTTSTFVDSISPGHPTHCTFSLENITQTGARGSSVERNFLAHDKKPHYDSKDSDTSDK
jgi:hypothetical protein